MYAIRVREGGDVLEAKFSGEVTTSEVLRAVSQGFALAEAGSIGRALCDLRALTAGPLPSISIIAASFVARLDAGDRVAIVCTAEQLAHTRQFARFARVGEELGVFTRESDAEQWLMAGVSGRISRTALHHMGAFEKPEPFSVERPGRKRASA
jgi:hypothetical protein